jgi:ABC-type phosphate transport system substrate-binding protein
MSGGARGARTAACAFAALALALAGCGVTTNNADREGSSSGKGANKGKKRGKRQPARPKGLVQIDGERQGSLTPIAVQRFNASTDSSRAAFAATGETPAFQDLCAGRVDIVDSVREISQTELASCARNGVLLAPKLQIASDAVVIATRNESDVGGDCITVADVGAIFRAGSRIENWSQLGFDDLPLRTAGPDSRSNAFAFFTQKVFGLPASASLSDFRSNYRVESTDSGVRDDVINAKALAAVQARNERRLAAAQSSDAIARQAVVNRAVAAADRRVRREINAANKRNAQLKIQINPAKLVRDNARMSARAKADAATAATRDFNARATTRATQLNERALSRAERSGVVGYFRFTYYENYEDQLRPLEIDGTPGVPATVPPNPAGNTGTTSTVATPTATTPAAPQAVARRPNCIFPSQQTITSGQYPLSRPLLLYVSQDNRKRPEVQKFLTYYLQNAQKLATQTRLVPLPDHDRDAQLEAITGRKPASPGAPPNTSTPSASPSGGVPGVASGPAQPSSSP